jgi:uncharacterized membrane protein
VPFLRHLDGFLETPTNEKPPQSQGAFSVAFYPGICYSINGHWAKREVNMRASCLGIVTGLLTFIILWYLLVQWFGNDIAGRFLLLIVTGVASLVIAVIAGWAAVVWVRGPQKK